MSGKTVRLFALSTLLTAGSAALGAMAGPPSVTPRAATGDAEAIACRHIPGNDQFSTEICSHDHAWLERALNGKALIELPTVDNPKGEGDPEGVTCRSPKFVWSGPLIRLCETNRFWADIVKNRQWVDAEGVVGTPQRLRGCGMVCDSLRSDLGSPNGTSFPSQSFSGSGNVPTFPGYTP